MGSYFERKRRRILSSRFAVVQLGSTMMGSFLHDICIALTKAAIAWSASMLHFTTGVICTMFTAESDAYSFLTDNIDTATRKLIAVGVCDCQVQRVLTCHIMSFQHI
eukprot:gnl/TRDRNA2_/TRDRNA2_121617_c0_seq1.p1 gnl/TRDRNA2_/TRDRNA2_121617_c0~~gnl/TRDRNA2_/TRDRNA2_121617_c0_seq1.p1  ORF type:complete len:107 (+),score=5.76 gnl/TRDRNA2_/TRDRNA2_121617_c0_seq1:558-878(+)